MNDTTIRTKSATRTMLQPKNESWAAGFEGVRVFRSSPGRVEIQIRTNGNTTRAGKPRRAFSIASLNLEEARAIVGALAEGIAEIEPRRP